MSPFQIIWAAGWCSFEPRGPIEDTVGLLKAAVGGNVSESSVWANVRNSYVPFIALPGSNLLKSLTVIKTGESGLTVFRLLTKDNRWKWVQANARLVYKNGKPDYIIATQRPLV